MKNELEIILLVNFTFPFTCYLLNSFHSGPLPLEPINGPSAEALAAAEVAKQAQQREREAANSKTMARLPTPPFR